MYFPLHNVRIQCTESLHSFVPASPPSILPVARFPLRVSSLLSAIFSNLRVSPFLADADGLPLIKTGRQGKWEK